MRCPFIFLVLRIGPVCFLLLFSCIPAAHANDLSTARNWTTKGGTRTYGTFVRVSGDDIIVENRSGQHITLKRSSLVPRDIQLLEGTTTPSPQKTKSAPAKTGYETSRAQETPVERPPPNKPKLQSPAQTAGIQLAGNRIKPGEKTEFFISLTPEEMDMLRREKLTKSQVRFGIWVPADFTPARPWRIFAVSRTTLKSNIEGISHYMAAGRAMPGWIIVAGDGPEDPPVHDQTVLRWVALRAGLNLMAREWGAKNWPIATGGFSGGGKMSGYLGALLMADGWNLIGMYMGGVNEDMASRGMDQYNPNRGQFKKTPIYIANGDKDGIAPVYKGERTQRRMKENGFRRVRMETYAGGHILNLKTVTDALAWFEQMEKSGGDESPGAARPQFQRQMPDRPQRPTPPARPQPQRPAYTPPSQRR